MNKICIIAIFVATMLASCAKEDFSSEEKVPVGATAYLYLRLTGTGNIKTRTAQPTTEVSNDNAVYNITVFFFDATNHYLTNTGTLYPSQFYYDGLTDSYSPVTAWEVPYNTKKVFVIINNYDYSEGVATPRFKIPTDADKGKLWSELNQTLYLNETSYGQQERNDPVGFPVNEFVNIVTNGVYSSDLPAEAKLKPQTRMEAAASNITMTNYGVRFLDESGTKINGDDNGLVEVTLAKTAAAAKQIQNIIYMDRVAAMIEFDCAARGDDKPWAWDQYLKPIETEPAGAHFYFLGWELNATNRKIRMYAEHEPLYTPFYNMNSAYRTDANYGASSYSSFTDWAKYKDNFVYLHNPNISFNGPLETRSATTNIRTREDEPISFSSPSAIDRGVLEAVYCPENTMKAGYQVIGATTKVVVKGNYVPAKSISDDEFEPNDSYFTYKGDYYTLTDMKNAYNALQNGSGIIDHLIGLAKDLYEFGLSAKMFTTSPSTDQGKRAAINEMMNTFDNYNRHFAMTNAGMVAGLAPAIKYYEQGINYYEVLIRHDQNITGYMALGKYGVVRNNWYKLILNKVTRPGTLWIPGGPDDLNSQPGTPDDFNPALQVTISVEPWTINNRGVELN